MARAAHAPDHEIHPGHEAVLTRENALVIYLILVSAFVVILNETVMSVALPEIMVELGLTAATGQWLSTAFLLTMAIVIPISGWLLKRFSTRTVFLGAMTTFSVGTLLAALSPDFGLLVTGRVIQAVGTGVMMPLLMTTVMTLVPPAQRGKMMGNVSIVISVAPALGPMISGLILSVLNWRGVFWLVLPIALTALLLGALKLTNVTETTRVSIDALSVVLSGFAFGGLVYGLSSISESVRGLALLEPWQPLLWGALSLALFIWRQKVLERTDSALLDTRVFESAGFSIAAGLMAIMMATLFGTIILLPIYLQDVLSLTPLATGLIMLPGGLLMGLAGPAVGRLYDRFGARALLIPGASGVSVVLWAMAFLLTPSTPWGVILALHVALSLSLAFIFTPLFTVSLSSVKPSMYSYGSAVVGTIQQLAGAAGTALFVVIYTVTIADLTGTATGFDNASPEAMGSGVQAAYFAGALLSLVALAATFFVRTPVDVERPAEFSH